MSDTVRLNLARVGNAVAILAGLVALLGAWVLLPHRMDAAEREIEALKSKVETQMLLLARIDENVKAIKERGR